MIEEMLNREDLPLSIAEALRRRAPILIEDRESRYRHGAVLIPLFRDGGEYKILFIKRTETLEVHRGQISFPGGRIDSEDLSLQEAALRETEEEIGLPRHAVNVLGRIDDARTLSSDFIIHAFLGLVPFPFPFQLNSGEVRGLLEVPLRLFCKGEEILPVDYEGKIYRNLAYAWDGEVIWGATARIMKNLVEIIKIALA